MAKFKFKAEVLEINSYEYEVEVSDNIAENERQAIAKTKLQVYLDIQGPSTIQFCPIDGITFSNSELGLETISVSSITLIK